MKPLLLQFTGAQSAGKTTLVSELNKLIKTPFTTIGEVSRTLLKNKIIDSIDVDASPLQQLTINFELMWQYYNALNDSSVQISVAERSPICCLAYTRALTVDKTSSIYQYVLDTSERFLSSTLKIRNTTIVTFYTFPLNVFTEDSVRKKESVSIIDNHICDILEEWGVHLNLFMLPAVGVSERLAIIKKTLNTLGYGHIFSNL